MEILKIHAGPITKHGEIDYEAVVKLRFVCYNQTMSTLDLVPTTH